ncbi:MAG: TlpA disulfide reductase family protein [Parasulfuritortus sp.]|nr:TlpA disulfide reductase family protein [Parasulfuritortus sp.]
MIARQLLAAAWLVLFASPAAAVDMELPTVNGTAFFRLADARPGPVVVNLWDTACPFCMREMPLLYQSAKAHTDTLFLGIAMGSAGEALDYLESHPSPYPHLLGPRNPGSLLRRLRDPSGALPHTVVLGPDHSICTVRTGGVDSAWLDAAIRKCSASH